MSAAKRKSKPVPFTENEMYLLEYAESQDKPFATYVKDLIRKDKESKESAGIGNMKELMKESLKELMEEMKFDVPRKTSITQEDGATKNASEKQKKSYKNLMK